MVMCLAGATQLALAGSAAGSRGLPVVLSYLFHDGHHVGSRDGAVGVDLSAREELDLVHVALPHVVGNLGQVSVLVAAAGVVLLSHVFCLFVC